MIFPKTGIHPGSSPGQAFSGSCSRLDRRIAMKRRELLKAAGASVAASTIASAASAQSNGATFVVAHGAWSAGWAWKKMHPLMSAAGHRLYTPTYTGLGDRDHLASPSNDLDTHIKDILAVLKYEDLRNEIGRAH